MKRRGKSIPRRMVFDREQNLSVVGSSAGSSGSSGNSSASTDAASLGGYVADDFELDLGIPTSSGYALVSDIDGIRSWINILEVNLAGFSAGVGGTVTASDSILTALQKLEYRTALDDAKVSFPGFGTTEGTACEGDDARLSDSRTPLAHNQASSTISDSTEAGRAILTAADAAAQRAAMGAGTSSLELGETSATAYRGDRGKTSYDHSQITSGNPHAVTKSDVGLGSVENTALSTWVGSLNVATLGTVTTGTWNGSAIGDTYISSAASWNTAYTHSQATGNPHNTTAADVGALAAGGTAVDASKLGALPVTASGARWSCIPTISAGGVMEVGKYFDFHDTAGDTGDYSVRIATTSAGFVFTGNMTATGGLSLNGSIAQYMYANYPVQYFYRINGSAASPTPVLANDGVGVLVFGGQYDTTPAHRANGALIEAVATGDYASGSNAPTDLKISTTSTTGSAERLRITSTGQVKIQSTEDCTGSGTGAGQLSGGLYCTKTAWIAGMLSVQGGAQLKRTTVSNADSTGAATDVLVVQTGTMSAARTHTLSPANTLKPGQVIWFVDESGSVGVTNTWTIQRSGSDTVENGTSIVMDSAYGCFGIMTDGSSKFTRVTR